MEIWFVVGYDQTLMSSLSVVICRYDKRLNIVNDIVKFTGNVCVGFENVWVVGIGKGISEGDIVSDRVSVI